MIKNDILSCAMAICVVVGVNLVPTSASAKIYSITGKIDSFSDPNQDFGNSNLIGTTFLGTINFNPEDIGSGHSDTDRIADILVDNFLTVGTPDDRAFVAQYGADHLFLGMLPFNPIVFSTASASRTCGGSGGVHLFANSQMSFNLSCMAPSFGGNPAYQFTISGVGTYMSAASVPEPSTWALLILGFAGIGFAVRRGRENNVGVSCGAVVTH